MPVITATEFKTNLGRYLDAVASEDVFITRQGKVTARLTSPARDKLPLLDELVGIASRTTLTGREARGERLSGT
ncbi:MAG: type II toxin-antitoxin system Phd/YefM family antitoxin [Propionibacteriaceae bacterium]|jgi:prevent-host-death family protein|nr:type II toxin-antitoxin system Phd/YefM family antitoxin [Propionibacteriaceae bacterium]